MIRTVFFSPHSDDEVLFGAYTLIAHRPDQIVICFASERDYGDNHVRMEESRAAMRVLGVTDNVVPWHAKDLADMVVKMRAYDHDISIAWAPDVRSSHPQHVIVATAAAMVFGKRLRAYHTYDLGGKVRSGREVIPASDEWKDRKVRALACYASQIRHPRASMFFGWDLAEYVGGDL